MLAFQVNFNPVLDKLAIQALTVINLISVHKEMSLNT
jgi:hypothetical protein